MYYSAACTQLSTESRPHNMTMMMMIAENYAQKNALVVGSLRLGWSVGGGVQMQCPSIGNRKLRCDRLITRQNATTATPLLLGWMVLVMMCNANVRLRGGSLLLLLAQTQFNIHELQLHWRKTRTSRLHWMAKWMVWWVSE